MFKNIEYQMLVFNSLAWDQFSSLTGTAIREHLRTWLNREEPPSVVTFTHPETQTTVSPLQADPADRLPPLPKSNRRSTRKKHAKAQFPDPVPLTQDNREDALAQTINQGLPLPPPSSLLPPKLSNNQTDQTLGFHSPKPRTTPLMQQLSTVDQKFYGATAQRPR